MRNLLILCLFFSTTLWAESKVKLFVSLTPAGSFDGVSEKLKGNIVKKGGVVTADKLWVSIETIKTGIDLRDEHFWKHLNSSKHPRATMTEVQGQNGTAKGMLEVNGVKKPITMKYVEKDGHIHTNFTVKASDYNLPKAKYLGVGVGDEIKVEAIHPVVSK